MWFSEDSVARFLGSHQLAKHFRTVCDIDVADDMHASHAPDEWMKLEPFSAGLHGFDVRNESSNSEPSFFLETSYKPQQKKTKLTAEEAKLDNQA